MSPSHPHPAPSSHPSSTITPPDQPVPEVTSPAPSARDIQPAQRSTATQSREVDIRVLREHYDIGAEQAMDPSLYIWLGEGVNGPATAQVWGDFEIGTVIGHGGMGLVYRALQVSLRRRCALKVMNSETASKRHMRDRFIQEAQCCARLSSPHIVAVYGAGEHARKLYYVMEYVEGDDLQSVMEQRVAAGTWFSPEEAVDVVLQCARGLQEAHRNQLVHRDIKPSNLILASDGTVKIADFGLVRMSGERHVTRPGCVVGTPDYMSPEMASGIDADHRSDLYSLGVVFFELLSGTTPFTEMSLEDLHRRRRDGATPTPRSIRPDIPQELDHTVAWLLARDPARRPQTAEDLITHLTAYRAGLMPPNPTRPVAASPMPSGTFEDDSVSTTGLRSASSLTHWAISSVCAGLMLIGIWFLASSAPSAGEDVAALRRALAVLDHAAPPPADVHLRLARLAAVTDPHGDTAIRADLERWRSKVERIEATTLRLDALAAEPATGRSTRGNALRDLDILAQLTGLDGRRQQERSALAAAEARSVDLRGKLAVLDGGQPVGDAQQAALRAVFDELSVIDGTDDLDVVRWRQRLGVYDDERTRLIAQLGELESQALLPVPRIRALGDLLSRYQVLVDLQDARLRRWTVALRRHQDGIAALQSRLAESDRLAEFDDAQVTVLLEQLDELALLDPDRSAAAAVATERIRVARTRRAELRAHLQALDGTSPHHPQQREHLAAYRTLVATDDADVRRWAATLAARENLRQRLALLDAVATEDEQSGTLLERYEAMVGPTDEDLLRWRARWLRITALRQAIPCDAEALAAMVGDADPQVLRQRALDTEIATLTTQVQRFDLAWTVAPDMRSMLERLEELTGATAVTDHARHRLTVLEGPERPAWASADGRDGFGRWAELRVGAETLRFRYIPGGRFVMGSPGDEAGRDDDERQVTVLISRPYWLAETETTQGLWSDITGRNPSLQRGRQLPVERISRSDCDAFIVRLNTRVPGLTARLPTEAEWEFACRAGTTDAWCGPHGTLATDALGEIAWYAANAGARSQPVAALRPNRFGLFDMHGNLWEWCADRHAAYPERPVTDPLGSGGDQHVVRGGSWGDRATHLRAANRLAVPGDLRSTYLGLRLAISATIGE